MSLLTVKPSSMPGNRMGQSRLVPKFAGRYFFDTEFSKIGERKDFISIGIVSEDNREFYAVSNEFKRKNLRAWVRRNILPVLGEAERLSIREIARGIVKYIGKDPDPHFYVKGGFGEDWNMLLNLFGGEKLAPENFPKTFTDVQILAKDAGNPSLPPHPDPKNKHNALADAHWARNIWKFLSSPPFQKAS